MGIFGTILGGTIGFALGGPLAAILGAAIGSQVGVGSRPAPGGPRQQRLGLNETYTAFAVAVTSLAAKVAKADGRVTQDEIGAFDAFLRDSLRMSIGERQQAARIFNAARDSATPASEFALQVGALLRREPDRLRDIVTVLLVIAVADGHLHPAEEAEIRGIARDMGLSAADYDSCRATCLAATGAVDTSPYEVLGVAPTATDEEVRSAHRRLVREYHPDVLRSKGLPDDFTEFANEKMSAISDAWSRIRKERGM